MLHTHNLDASGRKWTTRDTDASAKIAIHIAIHIANLMTRLLLRRPSQWQVCCCLMRRH